VDYAKSASGGLEPGNPLNQRTNIDGLYAIGECDYQYHGANRLGANSLLSCIFSGLFVGPCIENHLKKQTTAAADMQSSLFTSAIASHEKRHQALLDNRGKQNPYLIHQELGDLMTRAATVVRRNDQLREALGQIDQMHHRALDCGLSDMGSWTNQNVIFTKALQDMFPVAKAILKGALMRDESRGAHYKPEFSMDSLKEQDPVKRRQEAEKWCDKFEANTKRFLKSTIATCDGMDAKITYEDVDTSLIPPRPRLYGLVGAEEIEKVWKERLAAGKRPEPVKTQLAQPAMA
jgi:succinate dehydrogenase / fumarate reductase flavoprotein subunit